MPEALDELLKGLMSEVQQHAAEADDPKAVAAWQAVDAVLSTISSRPNLIGIGQQAIADLLTKISADPLAADNLIARMSADLIIKDMIAGATDLEAATAKAKQVREELNGVLRELGSIAIRLLLKIISAA